MRGANHRFLFPLVTSCAITLLAGCASLGPQLPMPTSEDAESAGAFGVRTLGASGEFELLSSAEVARRLQIEPGERSLHILTLSSGGASGAFGAGALIGSTMSDGRILGKAGMGAPPRVAATPASLVKATHDVA